MSTVNNIDYQWLIHNNLSTNYWMEEWTRYTWPHQAAFSPLFLGGALSAPRRVTAGPEGRSLGHLPAPGLLTQLGWGAERDSPVSASISTRSWAQKEPEG